MNYGFTLVELIIVMTLVLIISSIAIPSYINYVNKAKKEVCNINCLHLEKMYELHLDTEDLNHSESIFRKFLNDYEFCPSDGELAYEDEEVKCSVHYVVESQEETEGVPFL